ncbi:hypothetical protein D3C72_2162810 [compost metagenome]
MHVRVECSLQPQRPAVFRHDWCNNIDQLGDAGHFYPVSMLEETDQAAAHDKRIFQIIYILEFRRSYLPVRFGAAGPLGLPYIPFIKREVNFLLAFLFGLDIVAHSSYTVDELIQIQ